METAAFFDLDYTLLNTSSGLAYVREALKQGRVSWLTAGYVGALYQLKAIDFGQAHARLIPHVARHGRAEAVDFFREWVPRVLFSRLVQPGRDKLAWHQAQGQPVVIVSASIEEIVKPIAEYLGVSDYLCTHLTTENDQYTGQLDGPVCYGAGKIHWIKEWSAARNLPFPQVVDYVYTDSSSDLPLLELAAHPVPVNPSRKLAKIARRRGWPVVRFY